MKFSTLLEGKNPFVDCRQSFCKILTDWKCKLGPPNNLKNNAVVGPMLNVSSRTHIKTINSI